jgi:hypothetical protein
MKNRGVVRASRTYVVGGGELCYEGMLRKLGPTDCLTTYYLRDMQPIKPFYCGNGFWLIRYILKLNH